MIEDAVFLTTKISASVAVFASPTINEKIAIGTFRAKLRALESVAPFARRAVVAQLRVRHASTVNTISRVPRPFAIEALFGVVGVKH